jgi:hypothetical protein
MNTDAKLKVIFGVLITAVVLIGASGAAAPAAASSAAKAAHQQAANGKSDPRLAKALRFERGGWIYVHLEGSPQDIGFQHGYLLAPEIWDAFNAVKLTDTHQTQRDWQFFRQAAHEILWPHTDPEYQQELQGIVDGLKARNVQMDLDDVVALNAMEELADYYTPWLNKKDKAENAPKLSAPGNCSAFVATGSYTKDGRPVIAHNNWTSYMHGERWNIVFDIVPQQGHHIFMDGFPGVITSNDDFGMNDAGLIVTETTISQFVGYDPNGKPEFVRSRKAMQYATSIDEYVNIMLDGNNGGYANDWLLADTKTGEVARFEDGLKNHKVWKTKDGYFVGSNFASDPKLIAEETTGFDPTKLSSSPNARRIRWEQLMQENKGKIDVAMAQKFLGDHMDSFEKKEQANERTLCGHVDTVQRGLPEWDWPPYFPGGTVQNKAADATMVKQMSFYGRTGHGCGESFAAKPFLDKHPEFDWMKPLHDMPSGPWTLFKAGEKK